MTRNRKMPVPTILTTRELIKLDRSIRGPVAISFSREEWAALIDGIPTSRQPIRARHYRPNPDLHRSGES